MLYVVKFLFILLSTYKKLDFNNLKMIQNGTVYQPIKQGWSAWIAYHVYRLQFLYITLTWRQSLWHRG